MNSFSRALAAWSFVLPLTCCHQAATINRRAVDRTDQPSSSVQL